MTATLTSLSEKGESIGTCYLTCFWALFSSYQSAVYLKTDIVFAACLSGFAASKHEYTKSCLRERRSVSKLYGSDLRVAATCNLENPLLSPGMPSSHTHAQYAGLEAACIPSLLTESHLNSLYTA